MAKIEILGPEFLDPIYEIEHKAQLAPWSRELLLGCFENRYRVLGYLNDDNHLLGYLIFSIVLDESELQNIAVDPSCHNQGIGSLLLEDYFSRWADLGIVKSFLEVRDSNKVARHLYEKFGYVKCGLRRGYYPAGAGREDGIVMQCCRRGLQSNE